MKDCVLLSLTAPSLRGPLAVRRIGRIVFLVLPVIVVALVITIIVTVTRPALDLVHHDSRDGLSNLVEQEPGPLQGPAV